MAKQTCFGVRLHLRVCWPGLVVGFEVAPANVHELRAAEDLLEGVTGGALGDRNYWSPTLVEQLRLGGLRLLRKVLGHTLCVGLCQRRALLPLRMAELLTD